MGTNFSLVSPPGRADNRYRPPLGLMYIAAYLDRLGIKTDIIDVKVHPFTKIDRRQIIKRILREVKVRHPQIVGIPCITSEFQEVIDLSRAIKQELNDVTVAVGGTHSSLQPEDFFFENSPVDYAISGEGEITAYELAKVIIDGGKIEDVLCLTWFDKKKKRIVKTKPRSLIENLDELPFPSFDKVDMKYYTTPNPYAVRGVILSSFYVLTGRGCPYNCKFCVAKHLRKTAGPGKYVRLRSAENIVDEIEILANNYSIDGFCIVDDTFGLDIKRTFEFCDELLSRGLELVWGCETRVDRISEELLKKMKKAGCLQLDFGVESGSDKVLDNVQKGITVDQIKTAFKICQKVGIRTLANMLINLPGETVEDIETSLRLLDEIKPTVTLFNIFTAYCGTDIYNECNLNLAPSEYYLLGQPPLELVKNPKFRFSSHNLDFAGFYRANNPKYNRLRNAILSLFSRRYMKRFMASKRKSQYMLQIPRVYRELKKQLRPT